MPRDRTTFTFMYVSLRILSPVFIPDIICYTSSTITIAFEQITLKQINNNVKASITKHLSVNKTKKIVI